MYETVKNVPIPKPVTSQHGGGRRRKYPFPTMGVGEMFFIPHRKKNNMTAHASAVGKQLGKKFATRLTYMRDVDGTWEHCEPEDEGAIHGIGVWREA